MLFSGNKKSYTVYTLGASVLRHRAKPVEKVDDELRQLVREMTDALHAFDGIGLAAPQYGKSLRLVVFDVPVTNQSGSPGEALLLPKMPFAVINPEILDKSSTMAERDEGCLSLPGIYAPVVRPASVLFRAQIVDGDLVELECGGLLGRCIQHELDHLDGILFSDRVAPAALRSVRGDLDRLTKAGQPKNYRRIIKK